MFDKILIANRGEIACRVIRTCRRLGIRTVAVCSEADAEAPHARMADEAVLLGPPPAAESYLRIDGIVEAARRTDAQAVHPGYGFLSENPAFVEALEAAGIVFIGPPLEAIRRMGDKIAAKRLAEEAGVTTIPGHPEAIVEAKVAVRIARQIGYPVMIKAAAGGGGKGMRVALDERDLADGLARAMSEARSAFGDDRVFLEKFIPEPRHVEIQILADRHGKVVSLGERECSIQRRHQKVIEEAPSPLLDDPTRNAMAEQAVALARAVGYHSAGTVEFIADAERNFYFLEMNTRLQVEHPVTELITGLDLVEQMIRIAAGEPLAFEAAEVRRDGWAIEARVYAEDPARGFLPSTGRLTHYVEPQGAGIRVDSGVVEGSEVSVFYDPMIAKVCAHGADRAEAIARLGDALDGFVIRGPGHNMAILAAIMSHRRFRSGALSTDFIAAEFGDRFEGIAPSGAIRAALAALAVGLRRIEMARAARISGQLANWTPRVPSAWVVRLGNENVAVRTETTGDDLVVEIDGTRLEMVLDWRPGQLVAHARLGARSASVQVDPCPEGYRLCHGGIAATALVRTREAAEYAARIPEKAPPDTSRFLISPMPGLIVSIAVDRGAPVKAGQELLILEAMKMENVLRAERDAVVEDVRVAPGASVAADQVLIAFA
ncbi:MAG: acetyl-CoA carboxylase biotin carboxylase subunit [Geminicoccaceae bacterium]